MANNKVKVDVVVDDNGSLKQVGNKAKVAADGLDKVAKGAGTADRNLKGAAQASANGTKNFSKMSQGMGGLVGVYASLAAQVFALSAGYQFLKSAGDLKVLEAGQKAYATSTGIAIKTLTNDIIAATDAQISFTDAAQATAIGLAAGLTTSQLTEVGKAAKDVSIILGRDVTDSFNRLVRGITKAEPELLDELGVILRLETATAAYATTIGKTAKELTAYERTQAVAGDTLGQINRKYSVFIDGFDASTNTYSKLGKAVDGVTNKLKLLVDFVAKPLAEALTNTPALAIVGFALLLKGPLAVLGVSLDDISKKATKSAEVYKRAASIKRAAAERFKLSVTETTAALKAQAVEAVKLGSTSKILEKMQTGATIKPQEMGTLKRSLKLAEAQLANSTVVMSGIFKGFTKKMVEDFKLAIVQLEIAEKQKVTNTEKNVARMKAAYAALAAGIRTAVASVLSFGLRLLSIVGWVSIAVTALEALGLPITSYIKKLTSMGREDTVFSLHAKRIKELNKEYELVVEKIKEFIALNPGKAAAEGYKVLGNVIKSVSNEQLSQVLTDLPSKNREVAQADKKNAERLANFGNAATAGFLYNYVSDKKSGVAALREDTKSVKDFFNTQIEAFKELNEQNPSKVFETYITALQNAINSTEDLSEETIQFLLRSKNAAEELSSSIESVPRTLAEANTAYADLFSSLAPESSVEKTIKSLEDAIKSFGDKGTIALTPDELAELGRLQARKKLLEDINKDTLLGERALRDLEVKGLKNLREASEEEKTLTSLKNQQAINAQKILDAEREEATIRAAITRAAKEAALPGEKPVETITTAQQNRLDQLTSERDLLTENNNLLTEQAALEEKLVPFRKTIAEQQVEQQLLQAKQDMLLVDEKALQVLQERIKLEESRRSGDITRAAARLSPFADREKFVAEEKYKLEKELLPKKLEAIEKEFELKQKQIEIEYELLEAKKLIQANDLRILAETLRSQNKLPQAERAESLASSIEAQDFTASKQTALEMAEAAKNAAISSVVNNVEDLRLAKEEFADIKVLTEGIADSLESNMSSAFMSLIDGTKSAKQAFGDMAVAILKDIAQMITRMLVMRLLLSAFGGGFGGAASTAGMGAGATPGATFSGTGGMQVARYGGVMQPPPGYATGGIARGSDAGYPAVLHGTEAVVPLPNNRSIPVDLKGAGQQNNVTVNVSVANDGKGSQDSQASSNQGANLGAAIAAAVQKELQNQKRSGGILNPYGVA
jgi:hypothetical protein